MVWCQKKTLWRWKAKRENRTTRSPLFGFDTEILVCIRYWWDSPIKSPPKLLGATELVQFFVVVYIYIFNYNWNPIVAGFGSTIISGNNHLVYVAEKSFVSLQDIALRHFASRESMSESQSGGVDPFDIIHFGRFKAKRKCELDLYLSCAILLYPGW